MTPFGISTVNSHWRQLASWKWEAGNLIYPGRGSFYPPKTAVAYSSMSALLPGDKIIVSRKRAYQFDRINAKELFSNESWAENSIYLGRESFYRPETFTKYSSFAELLLSKRTKEFIQK